MTSIVRSARRDRRPQGYDARGRVTSTRWDVYQTATGNWTVSQTYDEADRIDTLTYPSGETVTYSYDNRSGQATSLASSVGDIIVSNATYTETGAPDQQLWGAGSQDIKAKWNYKADTQRLWKIKADKDAYGQTDLALLRYDYDLAGKYDDLYRLTKGFITDDDTGTSNDCADGYQATGTGWYDRSYNYDPLGNVDSWENHLNNNTYDYTYAQTGNAGLHAATALTGAGGGSFGYDQNGNQTSRPGGDTLVFDAANRLASYTAGSDTTTFAYDADGARIVRDEGATETIYVGGIYETDGSEKRSYYSFAGQVVAYRLQASSTDERYYLISDHLGTNTHQITYSDSSRSSQYYLPYGGNRGVSGGGLDTDRTYTGQVSDETLTGLMFYNARYYDPLLRRFISPDTIVPDPGNPQDLNRYSYVRNNPIRYSDPTGHDACQFGGGGCYSDVDGDRQVLQGEGQEVTLWVSPIPTEHWDTDRSVIGMFLDFLPGVGDGKGFIEAFSGHDLVTGESLEWWERGLGLIFLSELRGLANASEAIVDGAKHSDQLLEEGPAFFRGAEPGTAPDFVPKPDEFKIDPDTGFVKPTHGVSVFDNPGSIPNRFDPHELDLATVPDELTIRQRGRDPHHYEITPREGAGLTPDEFIAKLCSIRCLG